MPASGSPPVHHKNLLNWEASMTSARLISATAFCSARSSRLSLSSSSSVSESKLPWLSYRRRDQRNKAQTRRHFGHHECQVHLLHQNELIRLDQYLIIIEEVILRLVTIRLIDLIPSPNRGRIHVDRRNRYHQPTLEYRYRRSCSMSQEQPIINYCFLLCLRQMRDCFAENVSSVVADTIVECDVTALKWGSWLIRVLRSCSVNAIHRLTCTS